LVADKANTTEHINECEKTGCREGKVVQYAMYVGGGISSLSMVSIRGAVAAFAGGVLSPRGLGTAIVKF
jgi:hypothetical protein